MGQAFGRRSGQDEPIRGPMTGLARRALSASSDPIDLLDDALTDLRVSGCVLLHEAYAPGWAISVPGEASLRAMMGAAAGMRAMAFHLVRRGRCEILAGTDAMVLMESDLSLMVGGARHRLSDGGGGEAIPLEALLADRGRLAGALDAPGATELVCGVFLLRASPLNPLLGQLPTVLQVSAGGGGAAASVELAGVAQVLGRVLASRSRGSRTTERLLEILCAEGIRAWCDRHGCSEPGWLQGLSEPKISEAMRHIHAAPGEGWTVERLADRVALSPSRFAARFRETTGESVMRYVGRWRANVACRLLRDTDLCLTDVALQVGYESLPAFSRAFKAHLGKSPTDWRREDFSRLR